MVIATAPSRSRTDVISLNRSEARRSTSSTDGAGHDAGFMLTYFKHAHPFPSPPLSPVARSHPNSPFLRHSPRRQGDYVSLTDPDDDDDSDDDASPTQSLRANKAVYALCILNCFMVFPNSLIGPFFPGLALECGVSLTSAGIILSMFPIGMFTTGPFIGILTRNVQPRTTTFAGGFLLTVCTIAFAFVDGFTGLEFIVISSGIRFLQGIGGSAYSCGSSTLVLKMFPRHISITAGMLEMAASIGYLIGPLIGGFLYRWGGFRPPFFGIGLLTMMAMIPLWFMDLSVPEYRLTDDDDDGNDDDVGRKSITPMDILRSPNVIPLMVLNMMGMAVLGLQELAIVPVLSAVGATMGQVTSVFVMTSVIYGVFSGVTGWVNTKYPQMTSLVLLYGSLILGGGLAWFGGGLDDIISDTLPLACISLVVLMIGFSMSQNPILPILVDMTSGLGPDSVHVLSGVLASSVGLGEIIGPIIAGLLFDSIGLPLGASIMAGTIFLIAGLVFIQLRRTYRAAAPGYSALVVDV